VVRAVQRLHGPWLHTAADDSRPDRAVVDAAANPADDAAAQARAIELEDAAAGGGAADAALFHDRASHLHDLRLHDLYADAVDAARLDDCRGEYGGLVLFVLQRHRRIHGRPDRRSHWPAPRDCRHVDRIGAVHGDRAA